MNLTDFYFLCAFAIILAVYYLVPRKMQWGVLHVSSIVFFMMSGLPLLIIYPVVSMVVVHICARRIAACDAKTDVRRRRRLLIVGIAVLLAILVFLKYSKFIWAGFTSNPGFVEEVITLLTPLGLSYYTFTLISYLVDVYNGIAVPETDFFRLMTFGMYGPALVSGPIMQYREVGAKFFEAH